MTRKHKFEKFLREHGYAPAGGTKHDKWVKDGHTVIVPRNAQNWSIMIERRLTKEILQFQENSKNIKK